MLSQRRTRGGGRVGRPQFASAHHPARCSNGGDRGRTADQGSLRAVPCRRPPPLKLGHLPPARPLPSRIAGIEFIASDNAIHEGARGQAAALKCVEAAPRRAPDWPLAQPAAAATRHAASCAGIPTSTLLLQRINGPIEVRPELPRSGQLQVAGYAHTIPQVRQGAHHIAAIVPRRTATACRRQRVWRGLLGLHAHQQRVGNVPQGCMREGLGRRRACEAMAGGTSSAFGTVDVCSARAAVASWPLTSTWCSVAYMHQPGHTALCLPRSLRR